MLKFLTPLLLLLNISGFGQTAKTYSLDSLIEKSKVLAIENPQESRRLVLEIEKISKRSKDTDDIIKSHIAFAEFYIANKLWVQAEKHIDTATSLAKKQQNVTQQLELLILLSKKHFKSGDYDPSKH